MESFREVCLHSESGRFNILSGIDAILVNLLMQDQGAAKVGSFKDMQLVTQEVDDVLSTVSFELLHHRDSIKSAEN